MNGIPILTGRCFQAPAGIAQVSQASRTPLLSRSRAAAAVPPVLPSYMQSRSLSADKFLTLLTVAPSANFFAQPRRNLHGRCGNATDDCRCSRSTCHGVRASSFDLPIPSSERVLGGVMRIFIRTDAEVDTRSGKGNHYWRMEKRSSSNGNAVSRLNKDAVK